MPTGRTQAWSPRTPTKDRHLQPEPEAAAIMIVPVKMHEAPELEVDLDDDHGHAGPLQALCLSQGTSL